MFSFIIKSIYFIFKLILISWYYLCKWDFTTSFFFYLHSNLGAIPSCFSVQHFGMIVFFLLFCMNGSSSTQLNELIIIN